MADQVDDAIKRKVAEGYDEGELRAYAEGTGPKPVKRGGGSRYWSAKGGPLTGAAGEMAAIEESPTVKRLEEEARWTREALPEEHPPEWTKRVNIPKLARVSGTAGQFGQGAARSMTLGASDLIPGWKERTDEDKGAALPFAGAAGEIVGFGATPISLGGRLARAVGKAGARVVAPVVARRLVTSAPGIVALGALRGAGEAAATGGIAAGAEAATRGENPLIAAKEAATSVPNLILGAGLGALGTGTGLAVERGKDVRLPLGQAREALRTQGMEPTPVAGLETMMGQRRNLPEIPGAPLEESGRPRGRVLPVRGGEAETAEFQNLPEGRAGVIKIANEEAPKILDRIEKHIRVERGIYQNHQKDILERSGNPATDTTPLIEAARQWAGETTTEGGKAVVPGRQKALDHFVNLLHRELPVLEPGTAERMQVPSARVTDLIKIRRGLDEMARFGDEPGSRDNIHFRALSHMVNDFIGDELNRIPAVPRGAAPPSTLADTLRDVGQARATAETVPVEPQGMAEVVAGKTERQLPVGVKVPVLPPPGRARLGDEWRQMNRQYHDAMSSAERGHDILIGSDKADYVTRVAKERRAAGTIGREGDITVAALTNEPFARELEQLGYAGDSLKKIAAARAANEYMFGVPYPTSSMLRQGGAFLRQNVGALTGRVLEPGLERAPSVGAATMPFEIVSRQQGDEKAREKAKLDAMIAERRRRRQAEGAGQ